MQSEHSNSNVLFDWVSITSKTLTAEEFIRLLGMDACNWSVGKGFHGYQTRLYFDSISIHTNGRSDMGTWLEMTGQGCRAFETYGTADYESLFNLVISCPQEYSITRLDVAFDEFTGMLDIDRIFQDTLKHNYISKAESWSCTSSSSGTSINIGSPQSMVLIRIYDKLAERLSKIADKDQRERISEDIEHWIRVELQLRDDRAEEFIRLLKDNTLGQAYSGVMRHYLQYGYSVPAKNNPDKLVFHLYPYWKDFLGGAEDLSLYIKPGVEYNLERCKEYVYNMAGNAVDALIKIQGFEGFLKGLNERRIRQNAKYMKLIDENKPLKKVKPDGEIPEDVFNRISRTLDWDAIEKIPHICSTCARSKKCVMKHDAKIDCKQWMIKQDLLYRPKAGVEQSLPSVLPMGDVNDFTPILCCDCQKVVPVCASFVYWFGKQEYHICRQCYAKRGI